MVDRADSTIHPSDVLTSVIDLKSTPQPCSVGCEGPEFLALPERRANQEEEDGERTRYHSLPPAPVNSAMDNRRRSMVSGGTVTIGSWVTVKDGELDEAWHIVQHHEADAMRRHISEDSPLARALLGHGSGEQVKVQGPAGRRLVTILHVD
jgi:hypothetical protein